MLQLLRRVLLRLLLRLLRLLLLLLLARVLQVVCYHSLEDILGTVPVHGPLHELHRRELLGEDGR